MDRIYMPPPKAQLFYAEMVHDRIESQIESAGEDLKEGQSLLVEFLLNDGQRVRPGYIGFQNPNFIVLYGKDASGNEMKVLLPHTNIQVVITVLNKPADRNAIGFQSREKTPEI